MTERYFVAALVALPFVLAAAFWMYAFSLCGHTGRALLTGGLWLLIQPHDGWHEAPTYEDEPVRTHERRTEDERMAAYAAMRAETMTLPVTVSAAPYVDWTAELHPSDLDGLRASLDAVVADFQNELTAKLDAVLADFLHEHTGAHRLVGV